jgi:tetratricopeptide (TPR) repeat protein
LNHSTKTLLRIEAIFNEALAASDETRPALIETLCNGETELVAEVHSLLKACAAEELITASRRPEPGALPMQLARKRIGPYEIDRLLGRGGMGAVYLGHRADGQFEQQVAIKLIDLPLATDLFRERFRQERQILAGLQHPLIARLLDGGVTGEGDLYLVMEYVDGIPVHKFCEAKQYSVAQRLVLFRSVCEAVQFAHQNLVVHRDLKPDNIIVAEDGVPRLLDFGTAKLLSPTRGGPENEFTRQGYQSFTPQYASPEQVLGNSVTTASDTYSLGVLLYRLLTGTLPYELTEFTTEEMVRVICNEPPRRPSLDAGSHRRLDADLEAILLKALRKEPQERYLTAEQFASDVQAYLGRQPVSARRGTLRYRSGKFVRRNRLALVGAGLLAVTLLAGLAGVLWQARVANAERRKAEARSADLRQLSSSLLSELDEAIKQLPGSTGAQKLLVTRVLEHLDRMAQDSQGDRTTQLDLIDAYVRLGNIQGNGYEQNLGDRVSGLAIIDKAIALAEALVTSAPSDSEALRALAIAQESKGEMLSRTSDVQGAVLSLRTAAQTYDRLVSLPGTTAALLVEDSIANSALGDVLGQDTGLADIDAALASYRKSLDLDTRAVTLDPGFMRARRGLASMQMHIGNAELDIDPAQALQDFELALQRLDALPESERNSLVTLRLRGIIVRKVGTALSELGEFSQAIPLFEQAIQIHQKLADADPKDTRNLRDLKRTLQDEADSYEWSADPALAASSSNRRQNLRNASRTLQALKVTIEQLRKLTPKDADLEAELASAQVRTGTIANLLHDATDWTPRTKAGLEELRSAAGNDQASPMVLDLAVRAFLQAEPASLTDPQFALANAERGVTLTHRKTPAWLLSLAEAYRAAGDVKESCSTANQGLALLPAVQAGAAKARIRKLLERLCSQTGMEKLSDLSPAASEHKRSTMAAE